MAILFERLTLVLVLEDSELESADHAHRLVAEAQASSFLKTLPKSVSRFSILPTSILGRRSAVALRKVL
jgi:hypothetical protein